MTLVGRIDDPWRACTPYGGRRTVVQIRMGNSESKISSTQALIS